MINLCLFHIFQDESQLVTISGYNDVPKDSEKSFLKALANQPLSIAISASGRDFQFYSGVSQLKFAILQNKLLLL